VLVAAEFRIQTILAIAAMGLAVIAPLLKNIPLKVLVSVFIVAGVAAILLPIQQFTLAQPGISEAYNQTVHLGWGWWLTVAGIVMAMVGSLVVVLKPPKEKN
jgi:predicted membrane channel-forming protein YqfA (hemolysin III family)